MKCEGISLMDNMAEALTELAKASPFAVMCIGVIFILYMNYNKNLRELRKLYETSIREMKDLYKIAHEETRKRQELKK